MKNLKGFETEHGNFLAHAHNCGAFIGKNGSIQRLAFLDEVVNSFNWGKPSSEVEVQDSTAEILQAWEVISRRGFPSELPIERFGKSPAKKKFQGKSLYQYCLTGNKVFNCTIAWDETENQRMELFTWITFDELNEGDRVKNVYIGIGFRGGETGTIKSKIYSKEADGGCFYFVRFDGKEYNNQMVRADLQKIS